MKKTILYCLVAFFATLLSSVVPREVDAVIPGSTDCQAGCTFVAAGWPLAYLVDRHGTSPGGSVSLLMGFLGDDHIRKADFLLTFLFWLVAAVCLSKGLKRWRELNGVLDKFKHQDKHCRAKLDGIKAALI